MSLSLTLVPVNSFIMVISSAGSVSLHKANHKTSYFTLGFGLGLAATFAAFLESLLA